MVRIKNFMNSQDIIKVLIVVIILMGVGFITFSFLEVRLRQAPLPAEIIPVSRPVSIPDPASEGELETAPPAPSSPDDAEEPENVVFPRVQDDSKEESSLELIPTEPREFIVDIFSFTDWQPPSLVVYAGDTVTFINHDRELHWPGADPHPTHSSLPVFDALGGISRGQSYSHTFRKLGVYGHHDHLLEVPPTIGTITVLPR